MTIEEYNPNEPGVNNGRFMGFPFDEEMADCILLPVRWDATTSYAEGTSSAPDNILGASAQLDLGDQLFPDVWKKGIFMAPGDPEIKQWNDRWRQEAACVIDAWESGVKVMDIREWRERIDGVNEASAKMNDKVRHQAQSYLNRNKKLLLIGGDHSTPLGYLKALAGQHPEFGVLQIDAHCDLRRAYEGFRYSHASIMYNILTEIPQVSQLVQVGIRDWCPEESERIRQSNGRVRTFFAGDLNRCMFEGASWHDQCQRMIENLPGHVYISFDIDGLDPSCCPMTGTPVPGGMTYQQAIYLLEMIVRSGRSVIGADLCEVAGLPHEWDGNVGARLAYKLALILLGSAR